MKEIEKKRTPLEITVAKLKNTRKYSELKALEWKGISQNIYVFVATTIIDPSLTIHRAFHFNLIAIFIQYLLLLSQPLSLTSCNRG